MTREKAYYKLIDINTRHFKNKLINKIYDDFESRTCSNCIHCKESKHLINNKCNLGIKQDFDFGVAKDFGCINFKRA